MGFAVFVALGIWACGSGSSPRVHQVVVDATSYSPKTLEVAIGDTVVWTNRDLLVHTVTAKDGTFDSQNIAAGESWSYDVVTAGDLDYCCIYHSTMQGRLRAR